ncbi:MAG TPA: DUF86 domain-containing protein, partial [Anaerolineae bacterium]|nr:DUF86 domain-containing protein [Anaerolineae bacterium]
ARLQALNEYVTELDAKRSLPLKQILANKDAYYATLHLLQLASQAAIDIASHILASDFFRRADRYRDVILALGSEGVLPAEFAERFAPIAGFRNIIIHEYLTVDPEKVYNVLQAGLDDFRAFAKYVTGYLEKSGTL